MGVTSKGFLLFILWGGVSAFIFQLISPSNFVIQFVLIFFIGAIGAYLGSYLRRPGKK